MPWMDDKYLVDARERTLTPVTPDMEGELRRLTSSTRRVIKAVSGEAERLIREGYRVVQRAGEGLFRNPEYTEGPQNWDLRHIHYNSGSEVQATAKLLKRAGYKAEIQVNAGYGYGIYKVAKSWTLMTDAPKDVVFILDRFLKRALSDWEERQFPEYYRLLSERLGYDLRDKQDQTAGEVGRGGVVKGKALNPEYNVLTKAQFDALKQLNRAYPKGDVYLGEIRLGKGEALSDALVAVEKLNAQTGIHHDVVQYQGKYYSAPDAWVHKVLVDTRMERRAEREAERASSLRTKPRAGGGIRGALRAGWDELVSNPRHEPTHSIVPHIVLSPGKADAFHKSMNGYQPERLFVGNQDRDGLTPLYGAVTGWVYKRAPREQAEALAAKVNERVDKVDSGVLELVPYFGAWSVKVPDAQYVYSNGADPVDAWVTFLRSQYMEVGAPSGYWKKLLASGAFGDGNYQPLREMGWERNPGFVRDEREELGNAFVIHHEALQSGKVDGSGSRAIEAMIRRLGLSQREADYILELAGPGADDKRVTAVWKGLESTDPQWSREETERLHDVRIDALVSPDWGRRGNPRGRGGRGGRSSKPMPYPWEMEVRAAYSPRFMSKEQYGELANLWHLSRVPASGTNWGRYERMLWTAKEFHKAHPEVSEGGAYKDLDGLLSSGWRERNPDPHDPIVIDNYLKVRRGAVFHGSPDNVVNRYRLSDGRTVTVSGEGWYVSAGASYPEQSGKGVHNLNDWLVNEPARMKARAEAGVVEARKAKERKAEASKERSIKAFIEKLRAGIEKATGKGEVFYTGPERITPEAIVKGDGVEVTVELNTGRYFAYGIGHGFQPAKLFKYLAKYGQWEA